MLLHVPNVLSKEQVQSIRQAMEQDNQWVSGKKTAGGQAQQIKNNLQINLDSPLYQELNQFVLQQIKHSALIQSFALPKDILPPLFNCYQDTGHYGNHVDNAVQYSSSIGQAIRTDVSITVFLSELDEYAGGELIVEGLAERVQVRTAVGVHDALGFSGGTRGVVDRDDGPFVGHRPRQRGGGQIGRAHV